MAPIDVLLNLVPDAPDTVLAQLRAHPDLAGQQDAHGYSLLHAAASYEQLPLLRALLALPALQDPNAVRDEDGETCLFSAESVACARLLLEAGLDPAVRNVDGLTAAEKLDDEDEQPAVATFLRETAGADPDSTSPSHSSATATATAAAAAAAGQPDTTDGGASPALHPPPLPQGVQINLGTMAPGEVGDEPDPAFRRRIEELAARADFDSAATQRELRSLVEEAVSGLTADAADERGPPAARRRLE